jgi:hypothetical protein
MRTDRCSVSGLVAGLALVTLAQAVLGQSCDQAACPGCFSDFTPWQQTKGGVLNVGVVAQNGTAEFSASEYDNIADATQIACNAWNTAPLDSCSREPAYYFNFVPLWQVVAYGTQLDITVAPWGQFGCGGSPPGWIYLATRMGDIDPNSSALVVEHELGHEMGLADDIENPACRSSSEIMNETASYSGECEATPGFSIQPSDVAETWQQYDDRQDCEFVESNRCDVYCYPANNGSECEPNGQYCNASSYCCTDVDCAFPCNPGHGNKDCASGSVCDGNTGCCEGRLVSGATPCSCFTSTGDGFLGSTQDDGSCACTCTDVCTNWGGPDPGCESGACDGSGCCVPAGCAGAPSCYSAECGGPCAGRCCLGGAGGGGQCTNMVTDKLTGKIRCDPPGPPCQSSSDCIVDWYCNYNYCTFCGLPCDPDDPECWCDEMDTYSGTSYCGCLDSGGSNCGYPPWYNDYPAGCFAALRPSSGGGGGCGQGVATCYYGADQCAGTGASCDSNGCCTGSCQQPSSFNNGQCPVDWVQVGDCCEKPCFWPCNVDSDCASLGNICVSGCCGCVPEWSAWGVGCGPCGWGTLQCDGSCSDPNPPCQCDSDSGCECDAGTSCGNCGTWTCAGGCYDPCPNPPGGSCGGCGTWDSTGTDCDDPCNGCATIYTNYSCGNCGYIECNGDCYDPCACATGWNSSCGACGTVDCDGSCQDPCLGQSCGRCGTYQSDGSCNDPCADCDQYSGYSCGVCGVIQCDGSCDDPCS